MDLSIILAACLISLVGLPHGALDPVIAYRHGIIKTVASGIRFFLLYLTIVFAVVIFWFLLPQTALTGFLFISALHFGRDWRFKLRLGGFGYGALVLGLPALTNSEAVSLIFNFLLFTESANFSVIFLQIIGLIGATLILFDLTKLSVLRILEVCFLGLIATLINPLWYFVIYFCGFHSPRHLSSEFQRMTRDQKLIAYVVILLITIITLAISAISGSYLEKYYNDLNMLIYQLIFIGLAGLTVPHMCLLEWVGRKQHANG